MGLIRCPATSVGNYHCSLRNNPEGRDSHLLRDGSLKSRIDWQIMTDITCEPSVSRLDRWMCIGFRCDLLTRFTMAIDDRKIT